MTDVTLWRLQKAKVTFLEGEQLQNSGLDQGAVNRYYYSVFHAARALLATKNLEPSKHSGVISLFNKEFVKPGIISVQASKIFTEVFSMRTQADYTDFINFSEDEVREMKDKAKEFIEEISCILSKQTS